MSTYERHNFVIPEETVKIARASFPKGNNIYMKMRDNLGNLYPDSKFNKLFSTQGRSIAESSGNLVLITIMQFLEDLSDKDAANAVRSRIDWKYALGLKLSDPGFDASVLCEFRKRLIDDNLESELLDYLLDHFKKLKLLKKRGNQRTDSTSILANIRVLNRIELVGETLRNALNVLAVTCPEWLKSIITPDWFDRYSDRFDQYHLPKSKSRKEELANTVGRDGQHLLRSIERDKKFNWLSNIESIQILRRVWSQQYEIDKDKIKWCSKVSICCKDLIKSPYDTEARYATKRNVGWTGYKTHLTETCDADLPRIIINVETTQACVPDVNMTEKIHQHLQEKELLPSAHLMDAGYVDATHLVKSQEQKISLIGPPPKDTSWQARHNEGFDVSKFLIDWDKQMAVCPQGCKSSQWSTSCQRGRNNVILIMFAKEDCLKCLSRQKCTHGKTGRTLKIRTEKEHKALINARAKRKTKEFKEQYKPRAGIEGSISQSIRGHGMRRSRYIGLAKNHFQNIVTAVAINIKRVINWLDGNPLAKTRISHFAKLAYNY